MNTEGCCIPTDAVVIHRHLKLIRSWPLLRRYLFSFNSRRTRGVKSGGLGNKASFLQGFWGEFESLCFSTSKQSEITRAGGRESLQNRRLLSFKRLLSEQRVHMHIRDISCLNFRSDFYGARFKSRVRTAPFVASFFLCFSNTKTVQNHTCGGVRLTNGGWPRAADSGNSGDLLCEFSKNVFLLQMDHQNVWAIYLLRSSLWR